MAITRREFVYSAMGAAAATAAGATSVSAVAKPKTTNPQQQPPRKGPVVMASANGVETCNLAVQELRGGAKPVDAVVAGVTLVEDNPKDMSVGYGGLPNEDGVVELDSCVMDGASHKAGGVASIQNIRNPAQVALLVMRRTDHVLLVGDGARRFAVAHGFKEQDMLTPEARAAWLKWKESLSDRDDWLSEKEAAGKQSSRLPESDEFERHYGTINCCALEANGDLGGVTTTSGLSFKIPGRVGDSPIIGAGLYVDNDAGAAGSTGRGEASLQNLSSFMTVEYMRNGLSPQEACLAVLKRVADKCEPRLRNDKGEPGFGLKLYALAKDGRVGGASMHGDSKMAYHDGETCRRIAIPGLYRG